MNRAMLGRMMTRAGARQLPPGTVLIGVADSLAAASTAVAAGADLVDLGAAPPEMIAAFLARHPGIPVCATSSAADVVRDPATARVTGALLICADAESAVANGIPADRVLVDVLPAVVPMVNEAGLAALVDADRAAGLAARQDTADQGQADQGPADHGQADHGQADQGPADQGQADQGPADHGQADHGQADQRQADQGPADHGQAEQGPADQDPAERGPADQPGLDSADGELARVAGIVAIAAVSSWLGARAVRTRYPLEVRRALDMSASVRGIRPPARAIRGLA